jgi:hypothetical protein
MPDIAMCATENCPLAKDCYRSPESKTMPWERQSWIKFEFHAYNGKTYCAAFCPVRPSKDRDNLCTHLPGEKS